jgi:uncharacterized membrane protein
VRSLPWAPTPWREAAALTTFGLLRLRLWWERSVWVLPLLGILAAWVLTDALASVDQGPFADLDDLRLISTDSALALLAAVGGGMVTFTGFVFSVVLLMVQYGSSAYSPRTVSYFVRSRTTQVVLAIFLLTIGFSLLSLIEVGSGRRPDFVPLASVVVTILLLLASLVAFLALLNEVGTRIRVDTVLSGIGHRSRGLMRRAFSVTPAGMEHLTAAPPGPDDDSSLVRYAGPPGQIVAVDVARLRRLVQRSGCHLVLTMQTGDAVSVGSRIARITGAQLSDREVSRCLLVDRERSLRLDPLYGLRILTDVALRALSAAVHDPTTAVRALDEVEGVLRAAAGVPLGAVRLTSGEGSLVVLHATWSDVVDLALLEVLAAGIDQPQVTRRLSVLLDDLLLDLPPGLHPPLSACRSRLVEQVQQRHPAEVEVRLLGDHQGIGGSA